MQEIITSYLVQKKECGLPLLGSFIIKPVAAISDVANKQILSPGMQVVFSETADYLPVGLISYYSRCKKIPESQAEKELQHWCLQQKLRLDEGEKLSFNSIGSLAKTDGKIIFYKEEDRFKLFDSVRAERVIHKNDEHSILVGDRETTSTVMNDFYNDSNLTQKRFSWKVAALLLFIVSLAMLAFYFYDHTFSENTIGNQSAVPAANPSDTYKIP